MILKNNNNWDGIYAATICPMDTNGYIDEHELSNHFRGVFKKNGIKGILINGHAGENHLISRDEKKRIVEIAKNTIGNEGTIVCGINCESTFESQLHTEDAISAGADAIMVFPPFSWSLSLTTKMAFHHHELISKVSDTPMFLYQASIGTGQMAYNKEALRELITLPRVVAIKEGSWETSRYEENRKLIKDNNPNISVMASGDEHLLACFIIGTEGSLVSLAAIIPEKIVDLYNAVTSSDISKAKKIYNQIYPLAKTIYGTKPTGFATARIKACLKILGRLKDDNMRLPGYKLDEKELKKIKIVLNEIGLHS